MTDYDATVERDPVLGEEVWSWETSRGLPVRVAPTRRFRQAAAMITFGYGSCDLGFVGEDGPHRTPLGCAHYLEHKLFEDEEIAVFDRFARRGAQVNAMTSFTRTSYHFTATDRVEENLEDLLRLVSRAHVTDQNVEKERGIIAQEIRMYEDSPDYGLLFDFLGGLFAEHPVRHPVGGTVESIQRITAAELLRCYEAFYRTGNAALAVAGPVQPERVFELAEACALAPGPPPRRLAAEDLGPAATPLRERVMQVARPRVLLGYKDRDVLGDAELRARRQLTTRVLLDAFFARSSEIRAALRRRELVDDSLSCSYACEASFGFSAVRCETDDPERTADALRDALEASLDLDRDFLERERRKLLGQYVRSLESVRSLTFGLAEEALEGLPPLRVVDRMASIRDEDVLERAAEHVRPDSMAVAIVRPQR